MRKVVITGMGIWSCLGKNLDEVAESLYKGKSGIGIEEKRIEYGYRSPLTGIVARPELKPLLDRRSRVCLPEQGEYAFMATREALANAGIDMDYLEKNEVGVLYGNDSSAEAVIQSHTIAMEKKDTTLIGSGGIFRSMNSTVTMNLSTIFKLRGINMTISAACASGSHAIGLGLMFIRQGLQDIVICGGAQEVNYLSMGSFDGISTFSMRTDDPTKASRPFDKSRDGLVPSGGAATVILEDYDHAVRRGAPIIAEVAGYGFSSNGANISQPSDLGCQTAMERALKDAGCAISDIDYVNAHARRRFRGYGFGPTVWQRTSAYQLHKIDDRTRVLDGRSQRDSVFHTDDATLLCGAQYQLRRARRTLKKPQYRKQNPRKEHQHLPLQLLRFRRHQQRTGNQENVNQTI